MKYFIHYTFYHSDTRTLYGAGRENKARPNYLLSLRDGEVEIHELLDFVAGASHRPETKQHVERRRSELGERALREGLSLPDFYESLGVDERELAAENLTEVRERLLKDEV